jgi:general secretion pathway protein N
MLGLQLILPNPDAPVDPPGLAPRRTRPVTIPPLPEYAAILAEPIFTPDRHPGPAGAAPVAASGLLAGYAALGAATGHGEATAILSVPGGGVRTLHPGDAVEGWRLVGVSGERLTFERQGLRHALVIGAPAEALITPASDDAVARARP